jgi:hypothetical protein
MDKEEEKTDMEEVRGVRERAAEALISYLKTFYPEDRQSDSKHALMGPVGKLLTQITTTGEINWGAVKGYVLNIHKNQQSGRGVSAEAAERLEGAVDLLRELKELLPPTKWLKTVEDLDDEVFFGAYKEKLVGQRKGIQKKFHDWLKGNYSSIDEINKHIEEGFEFESFEVVPDPFSAPPEMKEIVARFWDDYNKTKEE